MTSRAFNVSLLPPQLSYTRGSVIPLHLSIDCADVQVLDLVSSPQASVVRLVHTVTFGYKVSGGLMTPSSNTKIDSKMYLANVKPSTSMSFNKNLSNPVQTATWWTLPAYDKQASERRELQGEMNLSPTMQATAHLGQYSHTVRQPLHVRRNRLNAHCAVRGCAEPTRGRGLCCKREQEAAVDTCGDMHDVRKRTTSNRLLAANVRGHDSGRGVTHQESCFRYQPGRRWVLVLLTLLLFGRADTRLLVQRSINFCTGGLFNCALRSGSSLRCLRSVYSIYSVFRAVVDPDNGGIIYVMYV